jgi:hypothetical protein
MIVCLHPGLKGSKLIWLHIFSTWRHGVVKLGFIRNHKNAPLSSFVFNSRCRIQSHDIRVKSVTSSPSSLLRGTSIEAAVDDVNIQISPSRQNNKFIQILFRIRGKRDLLNKPKKLGLAYFECWMFLSDNFMLLVCTFTCRKDWWPVVAWKDISCQLCLF